MLSVVYIVGCIVSAVLTYYVTKRNNPSQEYFTGDDAAFCLLFGLFSWAGVLGVVLSLVDWTEIKLWKFRK